MYQTLFYVLEIQQRIKWTKSLPSWNVHSNVGLKQTTKHILSNSGKCYKSTVKLSRGLDSPRGQGRK